MTVGVIFHYGPEVVETRVTGSSVLFRSSTFGSQFVTIDNLYLSKEGVIKEHPDLENDPLWKVKAIERFKDEMKKIGNENKIAEYIINDLKKYGYIPMYKQKIGHRVERLQ